MNTIELLRELLEEAEHSYDKCSEATKEDWGKKADTLQKAIDALELLEKAGKELPEKKKVTLGDFTDPKIDRWDYGFNQALDLCTPILAKLLEENEKLRRERNAFQTQAGARKRDNFLLRAKLDRINEDLIYDYLIIETGVGENQCRKIASLICKLKE